MLKLTPAQRRGEASGKRPYWRFLLSDRTVEWHDMVLGHREVALPSLSDPIVLLADGGADARLRRRGGRYGDRHHRPDPRRHPAHRHRRRNRPVRGAGRRTAGELRFAHLPPLEDAGEKRLARRVDARTLRSLRHDGVEGAALAAYLACVGTGLRPGSGAVADAGGAVRPGAVRAAPTPFKAAAAAGAEPPGAAVAGFRRGGGPAARRRDRRRSGWRCGATSTC